MGTVRVESRSPVSGDALIWLAIIAFLLMLILWPMALIATRPSPAEVSRAEQAARQQAQLDTTWRPWTTGAENLAIICGCLGVPTAIALVSFVVIRRTRVMWPVEDTRVDVRRPRRPRGAAGGGESAVLVGRPVRPEPQTVDAA